MYPTLLFGKKFILKIVPMFGEKILLKVVLDIVTIEHVEYPTFISAKKFILKLMLLNTVDIECICICEENSSETLLCFLLLSWCILLL